MIHILLKKNKYIFFFVIFIFLNSCSLFFPYEPVKKVNDRFTERYYNLIWRKKWKHNKIMKETKYKNNTEFKDTAYGRLMAQQIKFLDTNTKNNPYVLKIRADTENVRYLSQNADKYNISDKDFFENIKIPSNDFKYYNLGQKQYDEISNIELQEAYDYIYVINRERIKQTEINRLKNEALERERNRNASLLDRGKKGLKNLTDRIKSLIN